MPKFSIAPAEVQDLLRQVRTGAERGADPDPEADPKVTTFVVLAEGPGLKPAACKPVPPPLRAVGGPDAVLVVDKARFEKASRKVKLAILAHGLADLEPVYRKGGALARDGAGRPKLRKVAWSIPGAGHASVLRAYGTSSVEHANLQAIRQASGQGEGPEPTPAA